MFYHILFELKISRDDAVKVDLGDLEQIKSSYIAPYLQERYIRINGRRLMPNLIERVVIKESNISMDTHLERERAILRKQSIFLTVSPEGEMYNDDFGRDITDEVIAECEAELAQANDTTNDTATLLQTNATPKQWSNKIFIVHGHDNEAIQEVKTLLKDNKLEPVVLREQKDGGKTIIEKLEHNVEQVGYAVVLYTPCDEGRKRGEAALQPRARQNVVFEHGVFQGKLGRERICVLRKGDVEGVGDNAGVVYKDMDARGAWRAELLKELKGAGYKVDLNTL